MTNDTQRADVDADALAARAGDAGGLQPLAEFALEAKGLAAGRAERDRRAGNNGEPPQYLSDQPDALHNVEAEAAVLGAAMQFSDDAATACAELIDGDFYDEQHDRIFTAMLAVAATGAEVHPSSVWAEFERTGQTGNVGGNGWAADLIVKIRTNAGMADPLATVKRLGAKRRRHALAQRVATAALSKDHGAALPRVLRDELAGLEASADGPAQPDSVPLGANFGPLVDDEWSDRGLAARRHSHALSRAAAAPARVPLCLQLACAVAGDGTRWPDGEHGLRVMGEAAPVLMVTYRRFRRRKFERRRRALVKRGYAPATPERMGDRVHVMDMNKPRPSCGRRGHSGA